jgi:hypothetical protein
MNACQHGVPVCIERKGKKDKPKETLRNRVVQQSKRGLGHIITEEGCQTSTVMTPSRGALALDLPVTCRYRE